MDIYTAQYGYTGDDRLDITVKGNDTFGANFAPTWEMVNGFKNHTMSEDEYTWRYRALMNQHWNESNSPFMELAKGIVFPGGVTVVCFCKPGAFCHRILFVESMEKLGMIYRGERNFRNEPDTSTSGDLLSVQYGIICHQVNCQGVMGAGIAKAIADKWPRVKEYYVALCKKTFENGVPVPHLGTAYPVAISKNLYVANLFGQDRYGRDKRYTNYGMLRKAMLQLRQWRNAHEDLLDIHLPIYFPYRMGCSNAGGDWYLVRSMIRDIFPDANILRKGS